MTCAVLVNGGEDFSCLHVVEGNSIPTLWQHNAQPEDECGNTDVCCAWPGHACMMKLNQVTVTGIRVEENRVGPALVAQRELRTCGRVGSFKPSAPASAAAAQLRVP